MGKLMLHAPKHQAACALLMCSPTKWYIYMYVQTLQIYTLKNDDGAGPYLVPTLFSVALHRDARAEPKHQSTRMMINTAEFPSKKA